MNEIAVLNDQFRRTFQSGRVILTVSQAKPDSLEQTAIFAKIRAFNDFTEDNGPHEGNRLFWKIDYYAPDMNHGSENPADPACTVRVLTVMFANEY